MKNVVLQHMSSGTTRSGWASNGDNPVLGTVAELSALSVPGLQALGLSEYSAERLADWLIDDAIGDCYLYEGTYYAVIED